jgi:ADP-ribosylglycohydrolase|tara:strand:- start:52 stop:840 length:789 start_codon:yes stop_codon:yes gene_type:complete
MFGAIVGDVVGSSYERSPAKSLDFDLFRKQSRLTDDSVLTIAVADWILNGGQLHDYFHRYVARYPYAGYGRTFENWARGNNTEPYNSWGNGSAMRVSPTAYAVDSLESVLELAERSAEVTHNHPDGIAGAQATAGCVYLARTGHSKQEIREFVTAKFGYDLSRNLDDIRVSYSFDVSCAGSVPESIIAFIESESFESAIRLAISLGGDADTMACIAGAIAEPFYGGVPEILRQTTRTYLADHLQGVVDAFCSKYIIEPGIGE